MDHAHVPVPEPLETLARGLGERRVAFDRDDVARELREHRGLIARPRPDLEDAMLGLRGEQLGHSRDHVGLRDRLALADPEGMIAVRGVPVGR
jgi:hypothetical protein